MINVNEFKVEKAPATVYYIPNFVSEEEERHLLNKVYNVPKPKWTQLSNRRLQNWGGVPHPKGMLVELIPEWLSLYLDKVWQLGVFKESFKPNHVLVNEYLAGQGIMPHSDGPLFYPTITTLSLGSHTMLDFYYPRPDDCEDSSDVKKVKFLSLFVEPRSLLILQDDMYCKYLHGIEEKTIDVLSNSEIPNWYACKILRSGIGENYGNAEGVNSPTLEKNFYDKDLNNSECEDKNVSRQGRDMFSSKDFVQDGDAKCREASSLCDNELPPSEQNSSCISDDKIGQECLHQLQRGTRISLTMRHVPKTSKVKIKLGR